MAIVANLVDDGAVAAVCADVLAVLKLEETRDPVLHLLALACLTAAVIREAAANTGECPDLLKNSFVDCFDAAMRGTAPATQGVHR